MELRLRASARVKVDRGEQGLNWTKKGAGREAFFYGCCYYYVVLLTIRVKRCCRSLSFAELPMKNESPSCYFPLPLLRSLSWQFTSLEMITRHESFISSRQYIVLGEERKLSPSSLARHISSSPLVHFQMD